MRAEFNLLFWPLATVLAYVCARLFYRRYAYWWTSTLVVAPALLLMLALLLHTGYRDYMSGSHWLMMMLGPVIVAFALPLYEQRALIRRYWPVLLAGVAVGSAIAGASAWLLGSLLDLPPGLRLSLLPRSVATPFAVAVSSHVGGVPDLTAVFVIVTGCSARPSASSCDAGCRYARPWRAARCSAWARMAPAPPRRASWRPKRARWRAR